MIFLDGMRVLSMWWIVLGHVFFYGYEGPGHFNNFGFPGEYIFFKFYDAGSSASMQVLPGASCYLYFTPVLPLFCPYSPALRCVCVSQR